ncbi:MAG: hypothetical protein K0S93_737 [Nitrososphaeraceae archaeon]|jgi:hypothetical protein|nr:hypothetical protein [Nitrososphaeraceae archaeon]
MLEGARVYAKTFYPTLYLKYAKEFYCDVITEKLLLLLKLKTFAQYFL